MKRSYCLADRPFPVSASCRKTLKRMADASGTIALIHAPKQLERLRRGGYVEIYRPLGLTSFARITDAGRALLAGTLRGAERRAEGAPPTERNADHSEGTP